MLAPPLGLRIFKRHTIGQPGEHPGLTRFHVLWLGFPRSVLHCSGSCTAGKEEGDGYILSQENLLTPAHHQVYHHATVSGLTRILSIFLGQKSLDSLSHLPIAGLLIWAVTVSGFRQIDLKHFDGGVILVESGRNGGEKMRRNDQSDFRLAASREAFAELHRRIQVALPEKWHHQNISNSTSHRLCKCVFRSRKIDEASAEENMKQRLRG